MPTASARFPLFDACRALAALSVLLYHVGMIGGGNHDGSLRPIGNALSIGVPVFFAISGFLLYRPFVAARETGRQPNIARYAKRRVLRILPAYWVALTGLAIAFSWPIFNDGVWRYYGLTQIYTSSTFDNGLGVAWTLCIEATFYVLLPLYALLLARLRPRPAVEMGLLLTLGALSALVYISHYPAREVTAAPAISLLGTFMWFVPGMLLAVWTVHRPIVHSGRWWLGALVAFAAVCALGESDAPPQLAAVTVTPLFALLLLIPAANLTTKRSVPRTVLSNPVLAWLGVISYGLYLYHATLIAWVESKGVADAFPNHWVGLALLSVMLASVVAAGSWYLIERPALRARGVSFPLRVRPSET